MYLPDQCNINTIFFKPLFYKMPPMQIIVKMLNEWCLPFNQTPQAGFSLNHFFS